MEIKVYSLLWVVQGFVSSTVGRRQPNLTAPPTFQVPTLEPLASKPRLGFRV